jgi:hypothetical protein
MVSTAPASSRLSNSYVADRTMDELEEAASGQLLDAQE